MIILGVFFLRRRRLARKPPAYDSENKTTNEKPELHAESLLVPRVYEMDGMQNSMELEVREAPQELPAEEQAKKAT